MPRTLRRFVVVTALGLLGASAGWAKAQEAGSITVRNNFRFPVDQTVYVSRDGHVSRAMAKWVRHGENPEEARMGSAEAIQTDGRGWWVHAKLGPGQSMTWRCEESGGTQKGQREGTYPRVMETFSNGLPRSIAVDSETTVRLFDLALVEITEGYTGFTDDVSGKRAAVLAHLEEAGEDGDFSLEEQRSGPLVTRLVYGGTVRRGNAYRLKVTYDVVRPASVEVAVELAVLTREHEEGYLAIGKFLPAEMGEAARMRWKGAIQELAWQDQSPPRSARTHHWGRDVSWLSVSKGGRTDALLADFSANLTRLLRGRYRHVNDFLVNEMVLGTSRGWWMVSEYSRSNLIGSYIRNYYVLPRPEEVQQTRFRCVQLTSASPQVVDREFVSWAGYRGISGDDGSVCVELGVKDVEFGTSYFPNSTLGENFEYWKMAGLEGEKWWPVHKTVWQKAKEEIRRDMMIANALGLKWIRIHHLDSATDLDAEQVMGKCEDWLLDYIDFMAETARQTGMKLYLDLAVSPECAGYIAERYGDVAPFYEIQNEVLLRGVDMELVPYWKAVQEQIERRSDATAVLTGGPLFLGTYEQLEEQGVKLDAWGQHCYIDEREIPEAFKDYSLCFGGFASHRGKLPVNSEAGWRFIMRETLEQQAEHFAEIMEAYLSQQSMPLVCQFQFNETFCVPPSYRGALRHYELLHKDSTPKPQAWVYRDLIRRYASDEAMVNTLDIQFGAGAISPGQSLTVPVTFRNIGKKEMEIHPRCVLPEGIELVDAQETAFTLRPQEERVVKRRMVTKEGLSPGVYHVFEKVTLDDGVFFGWGVLSCTGQPRLALEAPLGKRVVYQPSLKSLGAFDLSGVDAVVFGKEAPAVEVDWAVYILESLRSATGADIQRYNDEDPEAQQALQSSNAILVGNGKSNRLVAQVAQARGRETMAEAQGVGSVEICENPFAAGRKVVLIAGADQETFERAASDFVFRYWRYAKDAMTFRVGMESDEYEQAAQTDAGQEEGFWEVMAPEKAEVGQRVQIRVYGSSEPPMPAPGRSVWAIWADGRMLLGKTNDAGEVFHTFESSGRYGITVGGSEQALKTLVIEERRN